MKKFIYLFFSLSITLICCKEEKNPALHLNYSLEEVRTIAAKYDLQDIVTMETNGGLRYFNEEELNAYFIEHKKIRDNARMDTIFYQNIRSVRSYADYEKLITSIPGMLEREIEAHGSVEAYEKHRAYKSSIPWHIYYEPNKDGGLMYGTLSWVRPGDDKGTEKGERLDNMR